MRPMIRIFVLAAALVSTAAAFAQDRAVVNVPFSFETGGKIISAGTYEVEFDPKLHALKLSSKTDRKLSYTWLAGPAIFGPDVSALSLKFDRGADGIHVLQSIRLEGWITPVLNIRKNHAAQHEASIMGSQ
jgi:hypothetical protein